VVNDFQTGSNQWYAGGDAGIVVLRYLTEKIKDGY